MTSNKKLLAEKSKLKDFDDLNSLVELHRSQLTTSCSRPKVTIIENRITFTVIETAVFLGISSKSVERAIKRGELYAKQLGRRWLISKSSIESWLNRKE